jgi:hypothetical protein
MPERWIMKKAHSDSDILWNDLNAIDVVSYIKKVTLIAALFIVCVLLVSPITVIFYLIYIYFSCYKQQNHLLVQFKKLVLSNIYQSICCH